jgi:hypothetical protein
LARLCSALVNLQKGTEVVVYIGDGAISDAHKRKIEQVAGIEGIAVSVRRVKPNSRQLPEARGSAGFPLCTALFLALPDLVPEYATRVLFFLG